VRNINLVSTTDTEEQVQEALGKAPKGNGSEDKSDAQKKGAETTLDSETKENNEHAEEIENEDELDHDESDDTESDKDDSKEDDKPKKKKSGFKRRLDKVLSRAQRAEQELNELKAKLAEGSAGNKGNDDQVKEGSGGGKKPRPESFDTHEEYVEALADWKFDEKQKQISKEQEKEKAKVQEQDALKSHVDRVKEFKKSAADFDKVISAVDDIEAPVFIQKAIISSEMGPELMYELAKDPDRFEEICSMTPEMALKAIGKFEAKIEQFAGKKPPTKIQTRAPAPLSPVGNGSSGVSKSEDDMSYREYRAHRTAQLRSR